MAQFKKGLIEAGDWKNNKEKSNTTKAPRKRVVISDESGEEEEDSIQDSEQETSRSNTKSKNTKSNGVTKKQKETIEVDSADESDYSGPEDDFKPTKSKSSVALSTKSSKAKATETKKPKISTRSRTLKTVQSTANIGSDRAKSLEITKADRNGITINNKAITNGSRVEKEEKPAKKEVISDGRSNGRNDKYDKETKENIRDEDEDIEEEEDKDDDILTELMSAQRPRDEEEKQDEVSNDDQIDNWYAPTQPYRSDDSDDERRTKKLQPTKPAQPRRSPVPKQTQYDNDDEVKLGSSVEIIPAGKNTHKMSANGHSISLQEKKSEARPVPVNTNNRQSLTTSNNRRRSDETGETGSHQNNSESLFDDSEKTTLLGSHSPAASNGKTRVPGTPMHLSSPPLEPRGSSPFLSKNKHKRRISEVSPTQRVTPSYDLDESASLFDDLTSPSGHIIKRRRINDTPLNNSVPAALDLSVIKELIENEVTLKLAAVTSDWESKFTNLKEEFEKQHNAVTDKVKELLKNQKNDVQNLLQQQKINLQQILQQQWADNKTQMKNLTEQIETISGSITELDKRLETQIKQLSDQQSTIVDKSIAGAESLLSSLRGLTSKSHK